MINRTAIILSIIGAKPGATVADIAEASKFPADTCAARASQLFTEGLIHRIGVRHFYAYYIVREEAMAAEPAYLEKLARKKAELVKQYKLRNNARKRARYAKQVAARPAKAAKVEKAAKPSAPPKPKRKKLTPIPLPGKLLVVKQQPKPTPALVIKESKIPFADRPVVMLPTATITRIPTPPGRFEITGPVDGAGFFSEWQARRGNEELVAA